MLVKVKKDTVYYIYSISFTVKFSNELCVKWESVCKCNNTTKTMTLFTIYILQNKHDKFNYLNYKTSA